MNATQQATHTPGPWKINYENAPVELSIRYSDGDLASVVARLNQWTVCEEHGTAEANARLIAAAPDLLAALEGIALYAHEADHLCGEDNFNTRMLHIQARIQTVSALADTAIAKARGAA